MIMTLTSNTRGHTADPTPTPRSSPARRAITRLGLTVLAGHLWLPTLSTTARAGDVPPPQPYGPVPTARQLRTQEMEFYGFLHFTVNTFTDREWGLGGEEESVFNPTAFDAKQIVSAAKTAGTAYTSWLPPSSLSLLHVRMKITMTPHT